MPQLTFVARELQTCPQLGLSIRDSGELQEWSTSFHVEMGQRKAAVLARSSRAYRPDQNSRPEVLWPPVQPYKEIAILKGPSKSAHEAFAQDRDCLHFE